MTKTTVAALKNTASQLDGQKITLSGWVRTVRDSKALGFIELNEIGRAHV